MRLANSASSPAEPLLLDDADQLLWRIARRADELVQDTARGPGLNRVCWLIAEQEVISHVTAEEIRSWSTAG